MSEREPLFRQEALEFQKRRASPADLVRLSLTWPKTGFWLVLLCVVALVVAASVARIERVALAQALVEQDGTVTALLSEGLGAAPEEGSGAAYLPADGGREVEVRVESVEESVPSDEARAQFPELAIAITGPVTILRASAAGNPGDFGQLRVRTGSEPVIVAFVPGLRDLFGES